VSMFRAKTVQQRPLLPWEVETWLHQRCRLNAWVADWEISLSASSYCSSRLKSCRWHINSLLTRKPPHAICMSNKCGKCTKLWHLMATWNCSWWSLSTAGDSKCNFHHGCVTLLEWTRWTHGSLCPACRSTACDWVVHQGSTHFQCA